MNKHCISQIDGCRGERGLLVGCKPQACTHLLNQIYRLVALLCNPCNLSQVSNLSSTRQHLPAPNRG